MSKQQLIHSLSALLVCAGFAAPVRADFVPISSPNPAYLAATTLLPVGGLEGDAPVSSITDGTNTATFFVSPVLDPTALTIYQTFADGGSWLTRRIRRLRRRLFWALRRSWKFSSLHRP